MDPNRWLRPEAYPLFAAVGLAVGIAIDPVSKEGRSAGVLENFEEGHKYAEHSLMKLVRNKAPQIMPSINNFFNDPK